MENKKPIVPQNNKKPIENVAQKQTTTYGAKRDKQTNGYDIENQPGYHNQYQSGVDDAPVQAQQNTGGVVQANQKSDRSQDPAQDQRNNVQAANDDVLTKGHVVTSQLDGREASSSKKKDKPDDERKISKER